MHRITLITGGARSGKSRQALVLAPSERTRAFLATAEPFDWEMRERIARHRSERPADFYTVEEPCDIAGALGQLDTAYEVVVIDCLTVWLANLMHRHGSEREDYPEVNDLLALLEDPPCDLIIVSNELGMGVVPENAMSRRFRDLSGLVNQRVGELANEVILMVSGLPMVIKKDVKS
jgi:adenosylcobinamide kinase/adenosylcobinamide-phosphate guanylyltransferase